MLIKESGVSAGENTEPGCATEFPDITALLDNMLQALDCDLGEAQSCLLALKRQIADEEFSTSVTALQQALNNFDIEAAKETVLALQQAARNRKKVS